MVSIDELIKSYLLHQNPAQTSEAAQIIAQCFAAIEYSAQQGVSPRAIRNQRDDDLTKKRELSEATEEVVENLLSSVFSDYKMAQKSLAIARKQNIAIATLNSAPRAIAPMIGESFPKWYYDWVFPWRFGRDQAYGAIPALQNAIRAADVAKQDCETAHARADEQHATIRNRKQKPDEKRPDALLGNLQEAIDNLEKIERWAKRVGVHAEGRAIAEFRQHLYDKAQEWALKVTPENIGTEVGKNYCDRLLKQHSHKVEIDDLHADVRQHGIDGPRALVIFGKAFRVWKANERSYEQRFSEQAMPWESSEDTPPFEWGYIIFADQALAWAREAMHYLIATSTTIVGTKDLRESEEAQAMDERGESLLQKASDFYRIWVNPHKNRGDDGGGDAAVSAWVAEIGEKVGDKRQEKFRFALHTFADELVS